MIISINTITAKMTIKIITASLEIKTEVVADHKLSSLHALLSANVHREFATNSWLLFELDGVKLYLSIIGNRQKLENNFVSEFFLSIITRELLINLAAECNEKEVESTNEDKASWALRRFRISKLLEEEYT